MSKQLSFPLKTRPGILPRPIAERFAERVNKQAEGCWIWTGDRSNATGYGRIHFDGRKHLAHRVSYELTKGPIPEGLTIDHLCRNRICVNPEHLEAVTNAENNQRSESITAKNARKTQCMRGHELSGDNLVLTAAGRACRQCRQDTRRARLGQQPRYTDGRGYQEPRMGDGRSLRRQGARA